MPRVSRLSGTLNIPDGIAVETDANGSTYRYEFRFVDHEEGTVRLDTREKDGQEVAAQTTQAVEDTLSERDLEVVDE